MNPTAIVKDLNVIEELIFSFLPRLEAFVVNEFILQNAEETFRHCVVESSCLSGSCSADIPKRRAVSEGEAGALDCRDHYGRAVRPPRRAATAPEEMFARRTPPQDYLTPPIPRRGASTDQGRPPDRASPPHSRRK